ncbi:sigma-70 family RNA polymerase sigma factor [Chitinophaga sp. SYP-B3965]|uniref:RNA polymerase sigma factor n=1 Tax=Chitinophaga sp. SYP-B3965 TaxID=2663120 RepID=UPI0012995576|nr:sigma-70 family RNA polymerase sigma factor [Chitinophaga sp. SYP-B3965]MRG47270.1 sigma-70 family RNA polymerase sigma factor [Chitinophaga sp. SYP-B3965]
MTSIRNISQQRFKRIVEETFDRLYASLYLLCNNKQLSEDIMQETYIRLWKNIDQVQDDHTIINLLKRYARNIFLDEVRSAARKNASLSKHQPEETVDSPEDCFKNRELNMAIQSAIKKLPRQQQIIFRLHKEHAMSYKQISARMNIGTGTIEVHMNRALKTLKQHLSHLQGID